MNELLRTDSDAAFCIAQVADWERNYKSGSQLLEKYRDARDFTADVIIFRLVENCPLENFDREVFYKNYAEMITYFDKSKKAKIILTTGFWKHPADEVIIQVGKENQFATIYLGDLGEDERMKAIGLFEHIGVANHPGDLGMKAIAERILAVVNGNES